MNESSFRERERVRERETERDRQTERETERERERERERETERERIDNAFVRERGKKKRKAIGKSMSNIFSQFFLDSFVAYNC